MEVNKVFKYPVDKNGYVIDTITKEELQSDYESGNNSLILKSANEWISMASKEEMPRKLWQDLWYEHELCCLFADSNVGKSIYAVQMAEEISKSKKVVYLDFELSRKQFQLRYTDDNGNCYSFPDNFIRAEMNPDSIITGDNEEQMLKAMLDIIRIYSPEVPIVDNITFLNSLTESADAASRLMMFLCRIKRTYDVSILILAHTPKRLMSAPITQNDLAGSKRLFNFFDSVFSIGKSAMGEDIRYIKQIKSRNGAIVYGSDNVLTAQIVKDGSFLYLMHTGFSTEREHLREPEEEGEELKHEIKQLSEQGLSVRKIAEQVGCSKSKVSNILRKSN